jgi:hypothetical protein
LSTSGTRAEGVTIISSPDTTAVNAGNIVAVGTSGTHLVMAEFCATTTDPNCHSVGTLDTTFGNAGVVSNSPNTGSPDELRSVAYQSKGNVLNAAGFVQGATKSMLLTQYSATSGLPNTSFGSKGALVRTSGQFDSSLSAVTVDSSGRTIGAGSAPYMNGVQGLAVTRVLGPTVSVHSPVLVRANPITVNFVVSVDEPLFGTVMPNVCTLASAAIIVGTSKESPCATVNITAAHTAISVSVQVLKPVPIGQLQTVQLSVRAGGGLVPSSTQSLSTIIIRNTSARLSAVPPSASTLPSGDQVALSPDDTSLIAQAAWRSPDPTGRVRPLNPTMGVSA